MADKTPADLRELERASKRLSDTQKDLAKTSSKAADGIDDIHDEAKRAFSQIDKLEKQISALLNAAQPLDGLLGKVNAQLRAQAGFAQDGASVLGGQAKAFEALGGQLRAIAGLFDDAAEAASSYSTTAKAVEDGLSGVRAGEEGLGAARKASGEAARISAEHMSKLGGAAKNAVLGLAAGEDPLQVLIAQGPALAEVFAEAMAGGMSFRQVLAGIALEIAPILAPLAGIGLAAAAIAAPFAIGAQQINKSAGDITAGLGLTAEQLANVKDKSVTMGDVVNATFSVVGERLWAAFGPTIQAVGKTIGDFYQWFVDTSSKVIIGVIANYSGAVAAIRTAWSLLPSAIGDVIISSANLVLDGVEKMINGVIGMVNGMVHAVNAVAGKLGLSISLPELKTVEIAKLKNVYEGAAKNLGAATVKAFLGERDKMTSGLQSLLKDIGVRAVEIAQQRIVDEAGNPVTNAACKCPGGNNVVREGDSSVTNVSEHSSVTNVSSAASSATSSTRRTVTPAMVEKQAAPAGSAQEQSGAAEKSTKAVTERVQQLDKAMQTITNINNAVTKVGETFEAAFGRSAKAVTNFASVLANTELQRLELEKTIANDSTMTEEQKVKARVALNIDAYIKIANAAKGFFDKHSAGYAALTAIEKAYRLMQFVESVKAMGQNAAESSSAIVKSMAKATASAAAGAAKIFESLGPFGFPVVAAMIGVLASLGLKGAGGGGAVPGVDDMKTRQEKQGSGSVLGDPKAKSESLEKALTHAQAYENKDLEYGNAMVRSLRSIDDQIGAVASALAKSFGAGGMLSTEGLNLGKTGSSASLSNLGFSKSTTRTLQDQGIQFNAATLGDIADGALSGSTYQQVLETTKKKAFFVTSSSKSKVITETGALDADFLDQVAKLIGSLGEGVSEAAKALEATGVEEVLASFKVDLGKLSFKDMTGTQIEEALSAIFGKLGDDMAKAAVPAIAQFQKVGDGAFWTLVRVARQYEVIDTTLKSVGMTFKTFGVSSLEARERLVDLVGGLDNLTDQTAFFAEHFLSDAERLKPVQDTVAERLTELKLPTNLTRDGFKKLVLDQNVSTKDGAELYAALMALAPAFDKVATAAEAAKTAIADKRTSIQDQIDELVMTPAQKLAKSRGLEKTAVEKLDASLLPLLKSLWDVQDAAQAAADAAEAQALANARSSAYADLLDAQGFAEQAKKVRRDLALAGIKDPDQQNYMRRTWAAQDAAEKVSAARDVLTQAYEKEKTVLEQTKDRFEALSESLRAFSASLSDTITGADLATRYRTTRDKFLDTATAARTGDEKALERLQADSEAFTSASRDYATTSLDYLRDVGLVRSAVDDAADAADNQVSIAEQQLDTLKKSVERLIDIDGNVISVRDAIANLQGALVEARAAGVGSVGGIPIPNGPTAPTPAPPLAGGTGSASFSWMLVNSMAGKANSSNDPRFAGLYAEAASYTPRFMDIVNTQGIEVANAMMAAGQLKFATGGGFEVGGSGPPDSKLFNLALSPGEAVNVRRRGEGGDEPLVNELRRLREELADLRATSVRIANSNDKMERTLTNVTEGGRAMMTEAAA